MPVLDLNKCFPAAEDGSHAPLPKQKVFLNTALDPNAAKYIAYVGGIGSGKTLIGCITVLCWAVMHKGDYGIFRQFMPELKVTTLKTFLSICPPELIAEHRVADGIIRIKCMQGGTSDIIFRPLEEPDKLRSLNLSGFLIDEANQVSEAAFMLLQGRLRGKGLRKGIIVSNPAGHDWLWRWFVDKRHIKDSEVQSMYYLIKAPSTENKHLPDGYIKSLMGAWSEDQIRREIYGDFDSFQGQVYSEFDRSIHVVKPFRIPDEWERVIGIDHGFRNPSCWLWGAVDYDGNMYVYREFYEKEWLIEEICKGKDGKPGVVKLNNGERIQQARIDPSVRAVRGQTGLSDWDIYCENLPKDFPLMLANNDVNPGIDKVKSYLKLNEKSKKPQLYIFETCHNLLDEITQYRWEELTPTQQGTKSDKEKPVKHNDHAVDSLRYMIMALPDKPKHADDVYQKVAYNSLEGALYRDLQRMKGKTKQPKDPFQDY